MGRFFDGGMLLRHSQRFSRKGASLVLGSAWGRLFQSAESSKGAAAIGRPAHFIVPKARMSTLNPPPPPGTPTSIFPSSSPVNPSASTPPPRFKRAPLPPPPGSLEGRGNILTLSLLAVGLSGAGYYYYITQINSEVEVPYPPALPPVLEPVEVSPSAAPPIVLSARDELVARKSKLEEELKELRAVKKRDPVVDQRKGMIKEELKLIANGVKELEKGAKKKF